MRFTDWISLQKLVDLPEDQGIFQVRIQVGLLAYPSGKSAMFFYGYSDKLSRDIQRFRDETVPLLGATEFDLLVRWMTVSDLEERFTKFMQMFQAKFGSLPSGNEALLRKLENAAASNLN